MEKRITMSIDDALNDPIHGPNVQRLMDSGVPTDTQNSSSSRARMYVSSTDMPALVDEVPRGTSEQPSKKMHQNLGKVESPAKRRQYRKAATAVVLAVVAGAGILQREKIVEYVENHDLPMASWFNSDTNQEIDGDETVTPLSSVGATALNAFICEDTGSTLATAVVTGAMAVPPVLPNTQTGNSEVLAPYLTSEILDGLTYATDTAPDVELPLNDFETASGYPEFLFDGFVLRFFACAIDDSQPAFDETGGKFSIDRTKIRIIVKPAETSGRVIPGLQNPETMLNPEKGITTAMPRTFPRSVNPYDVDAQNNLNVLFTDPTQYDALLEEAETRLIQGLEQGIFEVDYAGNDKITSLLDKAILKRLGAKKTDSGNTFKGSYEISLFDSTPDSDPQPQGVSIPESPRDALRIEEIVIKEGDFQPYPPITQSATAEPTDPTEISKEN